MANRQIYQLTGRTLGLTDVIPTQDAAGGSEAGKNTVTEFKQLIAPYKTLTLVITQSGTSTPSLNILCNELTGTPSISRTSAGIYVLTLAGQFTSAKTVVNGWYLDAEAEQVFPVGQRNVTLIDGYYSFSRTGSGGNEITILTYDNSFSSVELSSLATGVLASITMEVKVFY